MLGKPRILSLFPNSFNKFNKTWALMYDPVCKSHIPLLGVQEVVFSCRKDQFKLKGVPHFVRKFFHLKRLSLQL